MPPVHADVDVDIGIGDPLGIDEALKEEMEPQRLDVGDSDEIKMIEPAPEPLPGPIGMPFRLCPVDEVPDDQQVVAHPFGDDDAHLILKAILHHLQWIASRIISWASTVPEYSE